MGKTLAIFNCSIKSWGGGGASIYVFNAKRNKLWLTTRCQYMSPHSKWRLAVITTHITYQNHTTSYILILVRKQLLFFSLKKQKHERAQQKDQDTFASTCEEWPPSLQEPCLTPCLRLTAAAGSKFSDASLFPHPSLVFAAATPAYALAPRSSSSLRAT